MDCAEYVNAGCKLMKRIVNLKYGNKDMVLQNMVLAGHNCHTEYFKYFNFQSITVWRDPRDHFIKTNIKSPAYKVVDFIKYYRRCMSFVDSDDKVLYIRLEDLILNQKSTQGVIEDFLGISHDAYKPQYFNPKESASMAYVFRNKKIYDHYKREIEMIESQLGEYIFDFTPYESYFKELPVVISWRYDENNLPF